MPQRKTFVVNDKTAAQLKEMADDMNVPMSAILAVAISDIYREWSNRDAATMAEVIAMTRDT